MGLLNWFWSGKLTEKKLESTPAILSRYPLVPNPGQFFTLKSGDFESHHISNLHDFMCAQVDIFTHHARKKEESPGGYSYRALDEHRFPIWRKGYVEPGYTELLRKHAKYYGLKLMQEPKGWVIARCYGCNTCPRRIDCLAEEY